MTIRSTAMTLTLATAFVLAGISFWVELRTKNVNILGVSCGKYLIYEVPNDAVYLIENNAGAKPVRIAPLVRIECKPTENKLRFIDTSLAVQYQERDVREFSLQP